VARPSALYVLIGVLSWPVVKLVFRHRALGVNDLPRGGFVLSPNHTSNFDPWAVGIALWPRRWLRFMGKSELFFPPLSWILSAGGAFRVRRGEGDREAIETAVELVRRGEIVVVFPEGTRRKKGIVKKWDARPHTGAARIALAADAPLVPAAVAGTDRLLRLGPLRVRYGQPIPLDDLRQHDSREAAQVATDRLMAAIHELERKL
jgi:1-acyl-sn-glycerol-3-phosphate acyltransferase